MTNCIIKKPFPFSTDGFTTRGAEAGETRSDIPDDLIPGLKAEGYLEIVGDDAKRETKDAGPAPENKMEPEPVSENKDEPENQSEDDARVEIEGLRAEYTKFKGKKPFSGWDADTLRAKIAEMQGEATE